MSISNLFTDNSYKLYCAELDTESIVIDSISFNGNELVTKGSTDILTSNKIMVGDGVNVVKDTLADCDNSGNINIPLDTGYYINNQPIIYQDNADGSKYKAELNKVILNDTTNQINFSGGVQEQYLNVNDTSANRTYTIQDTGADANFIMSEGNQSINGEKTFNNTLKTNTITSIGANDDLILDANGTGQMRFNTIINNGCIFGGDLVSGVPNYNWAIKTIFNGITNPDPCCVIGTFEISGNKIASIGSNNNEATLWTPLYLQPVSVSTAVVALGDEVPSVVLATGAKLFTKGATYNTGDITTESNAILRKNGANGHVLTSSILPTSTYTHILQPKNGTVCHTDQRLIPFPFFATFTTTSLTYVDVATFLFVGVGGGGNGYVFNGSFLYISHTTTVAQTLNYRIQDITNGNTIISGSSAGTGSNVITSATGFTNLSGNSANWVLQVNVTGGSTDIVSATIQC